jgi:hypothetical protein
MDATLFALLGADIVTINELLVAQVKPAVRYHGMCPALCLRVRRAGLPRCREGGKGEAAVLLPVSRRCPEQDGLAFFGEQVQIAIGAADRAFAVDLVPLGPFFIAGLEILAQNTQNRAFQFVRIITPGTSCRVCHPARFSQNLGHAAACRQRINDAELFQNKSGVWKGLSARGDDCRCLASSEGRNRYHREGGDMIQIVDHARHFVPSVPACRGGCVANRSFTEGGCVLIVGSVGACRGARSYT